LPVAVSIARFELFLQFGSADRAMLKHFFDFREAGSPIEISPARQVYSRLASVFPFDAIPF
jgi:hypothetical protein